MTEKRAHADLTNKFYSDSKLRELALGATGGVWRTESYVDMNGVRRTMLIPFSLELPTGMEESDMAYIAAANPDAVLALLDELRRLHAENRELLRALKAVSEYDSYQTEYDGRMYDICPSCGKQDDDEHSERCSFSIAQRLIAKVEGQS